MHARLIEPHPAIESTRGSVAIERGPLVYCLEQADQGDAPIADLEIEPTAALASRWEPQLPRGRRRRARVGVPGRHVVVGRPALSRLRRRRGSVST
jgi:hypothetical protein